MPEEDEAHTDLREGEHDQPDRYARRPKKIGLRHDDEATVATIASPSPTVYDE